MPPQGRVFPVLQGPSPCCFRRRAISSWLCTTCILVSADVYAQQLLPASLSQSLPQSSLSSSPCHEPKSSSALSKASGFPSSTILYFCRVRLPGRPVSCPGAVHTPCVSSCALGSAGGFSWWLHIGLSLIKYLLDLYSAQVKACFAEATMHPSSLR